MSGRWSHSRSSAMQQSRAVAVAITFMVLIAVKKVLTRRVGGQGLRAHHCGAGTYLDRCKRGHTESQRRTPSTTIASFGRSVIR